MERPTNLASRSRSGGRVRGPAAATDGTGSPAEAAGGELWGGGTLQTRKVHHCLRLVCVTIEKIRILCEDINVNSVKMFFSL